MTKNPHSRPESLLKRQLTVLGLEPGDREQAAAERARIDGIELLPLTLMSSPRKPIFSPSVLALAAILGLVLVTAKLLLPGQDPKGGLRVKGTSKVWVYWEREGDVLPWSPDVLLQNGDRVRAEVLASEDSIAYLAVISSDGVLLNDPGQIIGGAVRLKTGERKSFSGSVKLVGANEGERLTVLVCAGNEGLELDTVFKGQGQHVAMDALPSNCGVEEFDLRQGASKP